MVIVSSLLHQAFLNAHTCSSGDMAAHLSLVAIHRTFKHTSMSPDSLSEAAARYLIAKPAACLRFCLCGGSGMGRGLSRKHFKLRFEARCYCSLEPGCASLWRRHLSLCTWVDAASSLPKVPLSLHLTTMNLQTTTVCVEQDCKVITWHGFQVLLLRGTYQ